MKMKMKMKINKNTVGVVGLGYVGLTLATVLAESGYKIIGIEKRKEVVDLTNKGIPHFSETDSVSHFQEVSIKGNLLQLKNLTEIPHVKSTL